MFLEVNHTENNHIYLLNPRITKKSLPIQPILPFQSIHPIQSIQPIHPILPILPMLVLGLCSI